MQANPVTVAWSMVAHHQTDSWTPGVFLSKMTPLVPKSDL